MNKVSDATHLIGGSIYGLGESIEGAHGLAWQTGNGTHGIADVIARFLADNGITYRCLQLSYLENENNEGYKKIVDFFISDDENHIPVRLDMHLRFGSAKAFLVGMKGIRNPITSQVK